MAFSVKEHFSSGADSTNPPPGPHAGTKPRSFAQVVANKRESLMSTHNGKLDTATTEDGLTIRHSHIWRTSRSEGAYLFDLVGVPGTEQQHLDVISQQYPQQYGIVIKRDSPGARYAEVYVDTEDHPDILTKGIYYEELKLRILPNMAFQDDQNIVRLSLRNLPFYKPHVLLEGLQQSLQDFGSVLDVGILRDPKTKVYMGTGYAVLSCPKTDDPSGQVFRPLSHNIPWKNTKEGFYATWANMPTWCRYCHEQGHTKFDCPKSLANLLCYHCHDLGHRSYECPRRQQSVSKKPRKTPLDNVPSPTGPTESPSPQQAPASTVTTTNNSNRYASLENMNENMNDNVTSSNWADDTDDEDYTPSTDGSDEYDSDDSNNMDCREDKDEHTLVDGNAMDSRKDKTEFQRDGDGDIALSDADVSGGLPSGTNGTLASKYAPSKSSNANANSNTDKSNKKAGARSRSRHSQ